MTMHTAEIFEIGRKLALLAAFSGVGAATVIGAYVVKSKLGIDLFEGPSFMHAYFYWR